MPTQYRPDQLQKDTVSPIPATGYVYRNGPWSFCADDLISAVVTDGSPLMQWIPARGVKTMNEHIAHLSWIAPEGFSGTASYMDYLASLTQIDECDYGPTTDWNGCEYSHTMHRVTFQSPTITRRDMGILQCERQPIYTVRGPGAGQFSLQTDADWAVARTAHQLQQHLDWNLVYGDPTVGQLMYDGLDVIIDTGWVADHAIGNGSCDFVDPLVVNGTNLTTPETILFAIKSVVRKIRRRAADRGVQLGVGDYAIVMSDSHWAYLADSIACGAMAIGCTGVQLQQDVNAYFAERSRITQGGVGYGFIEVDGRPVAVIPDTHLAHNVDIDANTPGVIGDIYVLTRNFGGVNILEHQYLNWNEIPPRAGIRVEETILQNGMIRVGWKQENQACFQYFVEMYARLVSRFQPLQAKITDVLVATALDNEHESGSFTSQDFYAFGGRRGGAGTPLITGMAG